MEAATIAAIIKSSDQMIEEADKKFEFDLKLENNYLRFHARIHVVYALLCVLITGILSVIVYFV
jgi:hypothetical protein